jgi:hypothetical protein
MKRKQSSSSNISSKRTKLNTIDSEERLTHYINAKEFDTILSSFPHVSLEEWTTKFTAICESLLKKESTNTTTTEQETETTEKTATLESQEQQALLTYLTEVTNELNEEYVALEEQEMDDFVNNVLCKAMIRSGIDKNTSSKFNVQNSTTVGNGIIISASTIGSHAGNGLFADQLFLRNQCVTLYDGREATFDEAQKLEKQGKATHIRALDSHHTVIIGLTNHKRAKGRGGGSFANDARDSNLNNTKFRKFSDRSGKSRIYLQATRVILPGEEIFVSYGKDYWKRSIAPLGSRRIYSSRRKNQNKK